jgi:(S)-2-hydroxyglutarate dehydrogenase
VTDDVDIAVVGGGIVGLAVARAAVLRGPDTRVVVLEKEPALAMHQSSRNSGVVHAGIYYKPGSIKARLCTAGRERLKEYALAKGLPYTECGKVIVAVKDAELARLDELERRAIANGVPGVRRLDSRELKSVEPNARGLAALHSPHTAITDFGAVARAYADDVRSAGGVIRCEFRVGRIVQDADAVTVTSDDGQVITARNVVVCAGLYSDQLAVISGDSPDPRIIPFRGDYYSLRADKARAVTGLIYPVPDPDLPFLGIHLTKTISGDVLIGPNAVLAGSREGYRLSSVRAGDIWATASWPGFWRFARKYWKTGMVEMRRSVSKRLFAAEAAAYLPGIRRSDLERAPAGVRAQAIGVTGAMVEDFCISRVGRVVNVRNAPSPAATSSLPIADEIVDQLGR